GKALTLQRTRLISRGGNDVIAVACSYTAFLGDRQTGCTTQSIVAVSGDDCRIGIVPATQRGIHDVVAITKCNDRAGAEASAKEVNVPISEGQVAAHII